MISARLTTSADTSGAFADSQRIFEAEVRFLDNLDTERNSAKRALIKALEDISGLDELDVSLLARVGQLEIENPSDEHTALSQEHEELGIELARTHMIVRILDEHKVEGSLSNRVVTLLDEHISRAPQELRGKIEKEREDILKRLAANLGLAITKDPE